MNPKYWRWGVFALAFLIMASVIFVTIGQRDALSWPEAVLRETLAPLQSGVTRIIRFFDNVVGRVRGSGGLLAEKEELEAELETLRAEQAIWREAKRENEELRQMLQLVQDVEGPAVVAEVIARAPNSWFDTLTIAKGRQHGISKGMAVITSQGVVGHVRSVTQRTAEVLLILDQRSALGARLQRTSEIALVEGLGSAGEGQLLVKPLARETGMRQGDLVVTSGLSGIYPKGLVVGVIEQVIEGQYGLTRYGILHPAVDFNRLEWVTVLPLRPVAQWENNGS